MRNQQNFRKMLEMGFAQQRAGLASGGAESIVALLHNFGLIGGNYE
jgi:hypothetical protein